MPYVRPAVLLPLISSGSSAVVSNTDACQSCAELRVLRGAWFSVEEDLFDLYERGSWMPVPQDFSSGENRSVLRSPARQRANLPVISSVGPSDGSAASSSRPAFPRPASRTPVASTSFVPADTTSSKKTIQDDNEGRRKQSLNYSMFIVFAMLMQCVKQLPLEH